MMKVIKSVEELRAALGGCVTQNSRVGLVPTMGALHSGHLSLVKACRSENDVVVVSVFVNRLQFNDESDYVHYPRMLDQDCALLQNAGVDIVFAPEESEMYPSLPLLQLDFGNMSAVMEGACRPGHFEGVGIVVAKLFNLVKPRRAYFGLKDLQQFLIIQRMVFDLSMDVELVGQPIVREESGLAMSSRNMRLSEEGKAIAANIFQGLLQAKASLVEGDTIIETKNKVIDFYNGVAGLKVEYLEIVDPQTLQSHSSGAPLREYAVCVAAFVEGIRLIDNLYLRQD